MAILLCFGGIYRDVNLICAKKESFDYLYYGTSGIIARCELEGDIGRIYAEPHVTEDGKADTKIRYEVVDRQGKTVCTETFDSEENALLEVCSPCLWDGKDRGNMYSLRASLIRGEEKLDETKINIGFRKIDISSDCGFMLNGRSYKLNGVAKHQDFGKSYNAASKEQINRDFDIISELGANSVRFSHYQHPQCAYDICDSRGLLVWAEIPMLKLTRNEELFTSTCEQLKELILQNIHHPSIFCWGIQNEIAMFRDDPFMHEKCRELTVLVHKLDPSRLSAGANLYSVKPGSAMNDVSDIVGYNLYFGWYYGQMEDYREHLDKLHKIKPNTPYGISEYGVDANTDLHSEAPGVRDYSEEYQALFHETVYPIFEEKKYLWGSFVWNMFDFNSGIRNEGGIKGVNLKGLVTSDREVRKDSFYYYKCKWNIEPELHICSKRFRKRAQKSICIKVYTNQPGAELMVNGESKGTALNNGNMVIVWNNIELTDGDNSITVKAGNIEDSCIFTRVEQPADEYRLLDDGAGTMVKNWFLKDEVFVKEGYLSVKNRADEIIDDPDAAKIIEEMLPELYEVMTKKDVIPLGLELLSIVKRQLNSLPADERESLIKKLNKRLNLIKDKSY